MKTIIHKLRGFRFEPAPGTWLAMLRMLVGASVVWYLVTSRDNYVEVANSDPRLFVPVGVEFHGPVGLESSQWLTCGLIVRTYFLAAIAKLAGPVGLGWMSGEYLRAQMALTPFARKCLAPAAGPRLASARKTT